MEAPGPHEVPVLPDALFKQITDLLESRADRQNVRLVCRALRPLVVHSVTLRGLPMPSALRNFQAFQPRRLAIFVDPLLGADWDRQEIFTTHIPAAAELAAVEFRRLPAGAAAGAAPPGAAAGVPMAPGDQDQDLPAAPRLPRGAALCLAALLARSQLRELALADVTLDEAAIVALAACTTSLRVLTLERVRLEQQIHGAHLAEQDIRPLQTLLQHVLRRAVLPNLRELTLHHDGVHHVTCALAGAATALVSLDLATGLGQAGGDLAALLPTLTALESLALSEQTDEDDVTPGMAQALAQAIGARVPGLTRLTLVDLPSVANDAASLNLGEAARLLTLSLTYVDVAELTLLDPAFPPTLTHLDLIGWYLLDDAEQARFLTSLHSLTRLRELHLDVSIENDEFWAAFALQQRPHLQILRVADFLDMDDIWSIVDNCPLLTTLAVRLLNVAQHDWALAVAELSHRGITVTRLGMHGDDA